MGVVAVVVVGGTLQSSYIASTCIQLLASQLHNYIIVHVVGIIHHSHAEILLILLCQYYMWQSQVENKHYSTVSGLIRLVIILSLECFIEITPDFLCPFMND